MIESSMDTRIPIGQPMQAQYGTPAACGMAVREAARPAGDLRALPSYGSKPNGDPNSLMLWGTEEDGPAESSG